jgi:hypothetical protein
MLILGHISGCTASLKPRKDAFDAKSARHAVIAQDGPETALCKSPFTADAAVLGRSTALRFESAAQPHQHAS